MCCIRFKLCKEERACMSVSFLIDRRLINREACKFVILSCVCPLRTVAEEQELDYLNERMDHDHWIIA